MFEEKPYELFNGECLEVMDKLIEMGVKVDCILTDPPYGTTACKWDSIIPLDKMWEMLNKLILNTTPVMLFNSEPFGSYLRMSNIKNYKHDLIWDKNIGGSFVLANRRMLPSHENISLFYSKQPTYNPIKTLKEEKNIRPINKGSSGGSAVPVAGGVAKCSKEYEPDKKFPVSIIKGFSSKMAECNSLNRVHPTQKPVALLEYLIKTYTNEGDIVLDFTMGSGSTGVACMNTNRKFIGIELDNTYFEIAEKRIAESLVNKGIARIK